MSKINNHSFNMAAMTNLEAIRYANKVAENGDARVEAPRKPTASTGMDLLMGALRDPFQTPPMSPERAAKKAEREAEYGKYSADPFAYWAEKSGGAGGTIDLKAEIPYSGNSSPTSSTLLDMFDGIPDEPLPPNPHWDLDGDQKVTRQEYEQYKALNTEVRTMRGAEFDRLFPGQQEVKMEDHPQIFGPGATGVISRADYIEGCFGPGAPNGLNHRESPLPGGGTMISPSYQDLEADKKRMQGNTYTLKAF